MLLCSHRRASLGRWSQALLRRHNRNRRPGSRWWFNREASRLVSLAGGVCLLLLIERLDPPHRENALLLTAIWLGIAFAIRPALVDGSVSVFEGQCHCRDDRRELLRPTGANSLFGGRAEKNTHLSGRNRRWSGARACRTPSILRWPRCWWFIVLKKSVAPRCFEALGVPGLALPGAVGLCARQLHQLLADVDAELLDRHGWKCSWRDDARNHSIRKAISCSAFNAVVVLAEMLLLGGRGLRF